MSDDATGLFFEDLTAGLVRATARTAVTEEEIVAFASAWDPQPFHLDRAASKDSVFGGLVASGLHTLMLTYRLYYDEGLLQGTALAGLGIDELRFLNPLRPGDSIGVTVTILDKRPTSRADRGVVRLALQTANQDGLPLFRCVITALVACRTGGQGA